MLLVLLQVAEEEVDTSAQTVVLSAMLPETPVTLISYAPVVVVDVVFAVSVDVCAVVSLNVSEDEERAHVAGLVAFVGALVIEQVSVTVPVNELPGVTVMVEVPLASGITVMLPLFVRVKLVLLLLPGASQKSPQPTRSGTAASSNRAHFPILIAAPLRLFRDIPSSETRLQGIA